ncbi:MAG TPA: HAD-IA family hydrolase [Gaiellaceae bacterium]|nr:HAD-IA family hydrolase [Gaiellaceae bacterium]
MDRWATFDCYGTLIDWNGGIRRVLAELFGEERADRLLHRYHELEPGLEADGTLTYREVLTAALDRLADEEGAELAEPGALARSLPSWEPFPEVRHALEEARDRGWRLAILSNTDPDYIAASKERIGVPFDETVVASEIGSYKPAHGHWDEFSRRTGADPKRHVHVAASLFHDIAPANELGIPSVWINRLGEEPGPQPDRELPDLNGLADALDDLVPG